MMKKNKLNKFYLNLSTKISSLKKVDLLNAVAFIYSIVSSVMIRKLVEARRLKNVKIIIISSMTL